MVWDIFSDLEILTIGDPKVLIITFVRHELTLIISNIIIIEKVFESNQSFRKHIRFELHNLCSISLSDLWLKLINKFP